MELILEEFDIRSKVVSFTTDQAANIRKAIHDMEGVEYIACFAHVIHNAAMKGINENVTLSAIRTKVSELVT